MNQKKVYFTVLSFLCRTESKPELVKTEMGPPPSPASTCSDTSSIASSASLPYSTLACLLHFFSFHRKFFFSGNNLLTLVPGAKAHNQFFHFMLSFVLCPWNRWCSGFHQHISFSCFSLMFSCGVTIASSEYTEVYLAAFSSRSINSWF